MKRYVKAWYVGEPAEYTTTKSGKTRSYYSNPDNWKEKQQDIIDYVNSIYHDDEYVISQLIWNNPSKTPWIVQYQSKVTDNKDKYFKFDLWEDNEPLETQKDEFNAWLEIQAEYAGYDSIDDMKHGM